MRSAARFRTASGLRRSTSSSSRRPRPTSSAAFRWTSRRLATSAPAARALGAQDLKPEKSVNLSLGATANPLRGLTLTADWYQIQIDDRIVLTETLGNGGTGNTAAVQAAVTALLASSGFPQVAAARFFINGLDTTTRGLDLVGSYNFRAGDLGRWTLTAAYNRNKTKIDKRLNAVGPLAQIPGIVLFGRVEGLRFTEGQPRDKIVLSADGELGAFGLTARTTRYGKVVSPGAAAPIANPTSLTDFGPDDIFLGRKWITDLELRWKPGGGTEFALGSNNVFDVYPDRSPVRAPADVSRRCLSGEPDLHSLFDLLAVRLQRPLRLRPRFGQLLRGRGGPWRLSPQTWPGLVPVFGAELVAAAVEVP